MQGNKCNYDDLQKVLNVAFPIRQNMPDEQSAWVLDTSAVKALHLTVDVYQSLMVLSSDPEARMSELGLQAIVETPAR